MKVSDLKELLKDVNDDLEINIGHVVKDEETGEEFVSLSEDLEVNQGDNYFIIFEDDFDEYYEVDTENDENE